MRQIPSFREVSQEGSVEKDEPRKDDDGHCVGNSGRRPLIRILD